MALLVKYSWHFFIKALLFSIASDSEKHSSLLKGLAESIAKPKMTSTNCRQLSSNSRSTIESVYREIEGKNNLTEQDWRPIAERLSALESEYGEEYKVFVQLKTLEFMTKQIMQLYNVDLERLRVIFQNIIADEEHHREVIATIRDLIYQRTQKQLTEDSLMRYREIIETPKWQSEFSLFRNASLELDVEELGDFLLTFD